MTATLRWCATATAITQPTVMVITYPTNEISVTWSSSPTKHKKEDGKKNSEMGVGIWLPLESREDKREIAKNRTKVGRNWVTISDFSNTDVVAPTTAATTEGGCGSNCDYNARHHSEQPNENQKSG
ncbi:unnamed protein product [Citrullus colocynthis]|uniref:Secreted protein n=1 Tax=Citrullus colocynthis TaxID=252529 RepID=A0ABP0XYU1_9ROSI